jgi:hypothetical protein
MIEVTERRGRRRKQLLNDFKGNRESLKEETVDRTPWRTRRRRGAGLVEGKIAELIMNIHTINTF